MRPDNRGHGPGKPESYGDGDDEGDPLDVKVVTERNVGKLRTLKTEALRKGNLRLYRECKGRIERLTREHLAAAHDHILGYLLEHASAAGVPTVTST